MSKKYRKVTLWEFMDLVESSWRKQHGMRPLNEDEKASRVCKEVPRKKKKVTKVSND